MLIFIIFEADL